MAMVAIRAVIKGVFRVTVKVLIVVVTRSTVRGVASVMIEVMVRILRRFQINLPFVRQGKHAFIVHTRFSIDANN
jgi:hypothetical protein